MDPVQLTIDVHCTQANWVFTLTETNLKAINYIRPAYRIFINDELFTERTWNWDNSSMVKEVISINDLPDVYHIKLEPVSNTASADFELTNFSGQRCQLLDSTKHTVTFKLQ